MKIQLILGGMLAVGVLGAPVLVAEDEGESTIHQANVTY